MGRGGDAPTLDSKLHKPLNPCAVGLGGLGDGVMFDVQPTCSTADTIC